MNPFELINDRLGMEIARLMPRILTQASRDPNSATFGSFDRDWWHYRIRDFPSIILQQAAWTVWLAAELPEFQGEREALTRLAAAGCRFWNARAIRHGAFEEYYPWECGYPAGAFSARAVMQLVEAGVIEREEVRPGAAVFAQQFSSRLENQAGNQQVAGLAALALIRNAFPELVSAEQFERQASRTLALQDEEGWYQEYGGPDLAYLAVTLDALWDLFDATGDSRFYQSAGRALRFMHPYLATFGGNIGMMNSRNTDYILPYGIVRFMQDGNSAEKSIAGALFISLFEHLNEPEHFVHAIDDRYLCHYTGHSLLRAWSLLKRLNPAALPMPSETLAGEKWFKNAGHLLTCAPTGSAVGEEPRFSTLLALKKGGVFTAISGRLRISDFGWVAVVGRQQYVNHWWADDWESSRDGLAVTVKGKLVPTTETISTPWKHFALRIMSLVLGERLIPKLKAVLIFKKRRSGYAFERKIACQPHQIIVHDEISGLPAGARIEQAPRSSKRHVSSADSFHFEDLRLASGISLEETTCFQNGIFRRDGIYRFESLPYEINHPNSVL